VTRLWFTWRAQLWIVEGTYPWIYGRTRSWIKERRGPELFNFLEGTQPSVHERTQILIRGLEMLKMRSSFCWENTAFFVKGRGLHNAALEASHAVYRDAKISLNLLRQNRHWRLRTRVVGTSWSKNSRVLLRLDLRFMSRIMAINWPLKTALIFMSLINGHQRAYKLLTAIHRDCFPFIYRCSEEPLGFLDYLLLLACILKNFQSSMNKPKTMMLSFNLLRKLSLLSDFKIKKAFPQVLSWSCLDGWCPPSKELFFR